MHCRRSFLFFLVLCAQETAFFVVVNAQCGRTLIAYGNADERVLSPWTALLFHKTAETHGVYVPWISGVIVGPRTILTRGRQFWEAGQFDNGKRPHMHGFKPENVLVGVGIHDSNSFSLDDGVTQIFTVEYIRPHPESYREHSEYDFAIVQLRGRIKTSSKVQPICLLESVGGGTGQASSAYDYTSPFFSSPKKLSGYLKAINSSTLFTTSYKLKPEDVCDPNCQSKAPSSNDLQLQNREEPCPPLGHGLFQNTFLAGAALASWHQSRWYFAGIVTKTYGCGNARFNHFISPVMLSMSNLKWIKSNVAQLEGKYACMSGEEIDVSQLCDGKVNCRRDGGSDEASSFCEAFNCPANAFNAELDSAANNNGIHQIRNKPNSLLNWRDPFVPASTPSRPRRPPTTTTILAPLPAHSTISTPRRSTTEAWHYSEPFTPTRTRRPTTVESVIISSTQRTPPTPTHPRPKAAAAPGGARMCPPLRLPLKEKEGIRFRCGIPGKPATTTAVSSSGDCAADSSHPPGTKITQTCMPYYKPVGRASFSEMTCGPDGVWRRGRLFECTAVCGLPKAAITSHIVNGTKAVASNWPWNAGIFKLTRNGFKYLCGATLISSTAVITAAHCVQDGERDGSLRVVLAPISSEWTVNSNHIHSQILKDIQIHVHEHYNPATFDADIAVIKTSRPVQISNHVYPACFPFPGRENEQIERYQTSPGSVGIVAGFGTDESLMISKTLKEVRLPVVSVRDCFRVLDVFPLTTQLCAGYTTGVSVCNGDSGAGLLFQEEGARKLYFVQGIVSHGQSGPGGRLCDYNRYSLFTKIGAFKDWVEAIVHVD